MSASVATESQEQIALFQWAKLASGKYPELSLMFAIPNGSHKSIAAAMKFKREGLKRGVPDVMLPVARGKFHGLFIELKRIKGGTVSDEQKEWIVGLREQGYQAALCHGWHEAVEEITDYLVTGERVEIGMSR